MINFCHYTSNKKHLQNIIVSAHIAWQERFPSFIFNHCLFWQRLNSLAWIQAQEFVNEKRVGWLLKCEICCTSIVAGKRQQLFRRLGGLSGGPRLQREKCPRRTKRLLSVLSWDNRPLWKWWIAVLGLCGHTQNSRLWMYLQDCPGCGGINHLSLKCDLSPREQHGCGWPSGMDTSWLLLLQAKKHLVWITYLINQIMICCHA